MVPQGRPLFALVTVVVLLVFFFAGPFSAKPAPIRRISNADARLARWIEVVSPPGKPFRPAHAYASPAHQPIRDQSKPLVHINLYPLGKPEANVDEYLNARKRTKVSELDAYGQAQISNALESQNPSEISSPAAPEGSIPQSTSVGNTLGTKKKGVSAGLSPLDRLPPADAPMPAQAAVAHKSHTVAELSPLDALPRADDSLTAKPAVAHKDHATVGLSPLDRLPSTNPPALDKDLSDGRLLAQESSGEHAGNVATAPVAPGGRKSKTELVLNKPVEASASDATLPVANGQTAPLATEVDVNKSPIMPEKFDTRPSAIGDKPTTAKAAVAAQFPDAAAKLSPPAVAAHAPALEDQAESNLA